MNFTHLYSEKKAAQSAAFFLFMAKGKLPVLKLTKLLYLAERKSLELFACPIMGDSPVSMPYGPVLSNTYNNTNGFGGSEWEKWIADRAGHFVTLNDSSMVSSTDDLLALSENDLEALQQTWDEFGRWERFALCDYTHDNCAEWEDPKGSSYPIRYEKLLGVLGYNQEAANAIVEQLEQQAALNKAFTTASHV